MVNGSEPFLRLIGDLPSGTLAAFEAAFGWGWLAELDLPSASREIVTDCLAVIDGLAPVIERLDGELHRYARADPRVKVLTTLPSSACRTRGGLRRSWPWSSPRQLRHEHNDLAADA